MTSVVRTPITAPGREQAAKPTRVTPQLHASLVMWLHGPAAADELIRKATAR